MAEKIKIGGELDPRTPEKILGDASTIKDRTWETNHGDVAQTPNQKQDEINEYFQDQIDNIVATEQGGIQTDAAPTEGSVKLVQSGGTYTTIQNAVTAAKTFSTGETVPTTGIDTNPTNNSTNLVKSGGVKTAIDNVAFSTNEKVNTVGIDSEPTAGSNNLVKSDGVVTFANSIINSDKESQFNDTSDKYVIADKQGNIIAAITKGGVQAPNITALNNILVQLVPVVNQLNDDINTKLDKDSNIEDIVFDSSDRFVICDRNKNIIATITKDGIKSPDINELKRVVSLLLTSVDQLENNVSGKLDKDSNHEDIISDNSKEFSICDGGGNIGFTITKDGKIKGNFDIKQNVLSYTNDLHCQNVITPIIGNYGEDNAVYGFYNMYDTFRIAFDFRLNENINVLGTDKPFIELVGENTKYVKPIHAVPTDLYVEKNGDTYDAISQVIGLNSGFDICGTSFVRTLVTNKPIIGDTAFAMWLKGNFNEESDFPTQQEIADRASWLGAHSTAQINFSNDTFTVSGVDSQDISVSIKTGNVYKPLGTFYDDLVSALGSYFVFKKRRLSADKTTEDLLQFGTLKLVSNYYQQTDKSSTSLSYNYDSFPVSIPLAIDETLHTAEIVSVDGNVYVSIDGNFVKYSGSIKEVYIGGTSSESGKITCLNFEYNNGTLGDAIVSDTYGIISERSPRIIGVMQHLIEDKYEGETLSQQYYTSVSRMLDTFRLLENRGYTVLTLNDVCLWLSGRKRVPARSIFFLATTNPTFTQFLNDLLSRELWTGSSVPLIIGSIIKGDVTSAGDSDELLKKVVSARGSGFDYITHLYDHDVMPDYKNSLILQQELYKLIRLCISSGIDTRMYSYGWSCSSVNYYNMLSLNGFIGAMGGGSPSIKATNNYQLGRVQLCDNTSMTVLKNILI